MNLNRTLAVGLVCLLAGTGLVGCSGSESAAEDTPAERELDTIEEDEVLVTIGDQQITMVQIREEVGENLDRLEHQYLRQRHELVQGALDELLEDRLIEDEAKKRGISTYELIDAEVNSKLEITEQDIETWYTANQEQTQGRSIEEIRSQIESLLREQRREQLTKDLLQRLRTEGNVVYHLEPFRVDLQNEGSPALGPADAPVTLVEFSDFECPFCSRFFPTLKQLERNYGDSLRIVYRQFPLTNIHPSAFKAAEASLCAHEQGKFWEFHDALFQDQERLAVKDLKETARQLGLDGEDFDACLDSGRYVERVQTDLEEGQTVGISGTPALFVNGIMIPGGAVPYETVAEVIDLELSRSGS